MSSFFFSKILRIPERIEALWGIMRQELVKKKETSTNLGQLEKAFKRRWAKIGPQTLKNLVVTSIIACLHVSHYVSSLLENTLTAEMKLLCLYYMREGDGELSIYF